MPADVSVIIPTFRRPQQLLEAVASVLTQEGVSVDVLVIDDSSEGSGRSALECIQDRRVRYQKMDAPTGGKPALVRNAGWPQTDGEFVHFLDDDDRVLPGAYRDMVAALKANSHTGMVFGSIEPFGDDPVVLKHERAYFRRAARRARWSSRLKCRQLMAGIMMFKGTMLVNSACMIRRDCIDSVGGFPCDCELIEDVDFWTRVMRLCGCVYLERPVIQYRTGAPSLMSNPKSTHSLEASARISHDRYRKLYGKLEVFALQVITKTILRPL